MPNIKMMAAGWRLFLRSLDLQVKHVRENGRLNPHRSAQLGICLRVMTKGLLGAKSGT